MTDCHTREYWRSTKGTWKSGVQDLSHNLLVPTLHQCGPQNPKGFFVSFYSSPPVVEDCSGGVCNRLGALQLRLHHVVGDAQARSQFTQVEGAGHVTSHVDQLQGAELPLKIENTVRDRATCEILYLLCQNCFPWSSS